jgi:hypothetical protein
MKNVKRVGIVIGALLGVAVAGLVALRAWPRHTPAGQPPLMTLTSAAQMRAIFNESAGEQRLLVLLSPTCPTCVAGASGLGALLEKGSALRLQTLVVWMPVIKTDVAAPTSAKLALVPGPHVRQFWDPRHFISQAMLATARSHLDRLSQEQRDLLERAPVAWDVVALFPPGAQWEAELPWPALWGFPVVDTLDRLGEQLAPGAPAPQ